MPPLPSLRRIRTPCWFVTATSGLPLLLKDPVATAVGEVPAGNAGAAPKEIVCPRALDVDHIKTVTIASIKLIRPIVFISLLRLLLPMAPNSVNSVFCLVEREFERNWLRDEERFRRLP